MLELFWAHKVVEAKLVGDDEVVIEATKADPEMWTSLQREDLDPKEKISIRNSAVKEVHENEARLAEDRCKSKRDRELEAISKSLEDDEKRRRKVEEEKTKAKAEAFKEVNMKKVPKFSTGLATKIAKERELFENLPPPATETAVIKVTFQSTEPNKSNEKTGKCDIKGLMEKGNDAFNQQNLSKAIKCFDEVLEIDSGYAAAYNNRSACYLKAGNLHGTLNDASKAIDLMLKNDDDDKSKQISKAYSRRGQALIELDMLNEALAELETASKYDEDNLGLRKDLNELRQRIECQPDTE